MLALSGNFMFSTFKHLSMYKYIVSGHNIWDFTFSVFSVVEKAKGDKRCSIIIDLSPCYPIECRLSCITERNGDGECVVSKVGSTPNCLCTYDC